MNLEQLRDRFYKEKVRFLLKDRRRTNKAIYEITAAFLTERINCGEPNFRSELSKLQKLIEEDDRFLKFLNNIKF